MCVISAFFASHTIRMVNGDKRINMMYQKSENEKNAKFYDTLNTRFTVSKGLRH